MKNVYILQNSNLSFDMDISKLYSPEKYRLFLIINKFGLKALKSRIQEHYFEKIWELNTFDFNQIKEIIITNQKHYHAPIQIVTNAEEAVTVCGNLRVFFNIDELNYDRFINKVIMKELLDKPCLLTPKYVFFDKNRFTNNCADYLREITQKLSFPLIAKPIDSMSCMGVKKILSTEELNIWCGNAIRTDCDYEIDEYIEGKVYNCDSFIKNGKIIFTQVSECSNTCYDFICGLTKGTIPIQKTDPKYSLLSTYTRKVHDAIKTPAGGVTHLEIILTNKSEIYFIEIGYRSPGILIPAMYKKFLDIGTIESHILLQIDKDYDFDINYGPYCAWIAFPSMDGRLVKKYRPKIQSDYRLEWINQIGDAMRGPTNGRDYAGRVLMWNNDYRQLKNDFYSLNTFKFFDVKNDSLIV